MSLKLHRFLFCLKIINSNKLIISTCHKFLIWNPLTISQRFLTNIKCLYKCLFFIIEDKNFSIILTSKKEFKIRMKRNSFTFIPIMLKFFLIFNFHSFYNNFIFNKILMWFNQRDFQMILSNLKEINQKFIYCFSPFESAGFYP